LFFAAVWRNKDVYLTNSCECDKNLYSGVYTWWASVRHNQQPGHNHAADCQPTALVPLVSLVQSAGTLYQTIWSHLTFLLIVLGSS